ncbi:MAG: hypothetical protein P8X74_02945 [Reinekea sp.]
MGAPASFEKQIEIKLLHPASTLKSRIQARARFCFPAARKSLKLLYFSNLAATFSV